MTQNDNLKFYSSIEKNPYCQKVFSLHKRCLYCPLFFDSFTILLEETNIAKIVMEALIKWAVRDKVQGDNRTSLGYVDLAMQ